ncbi:MAG: hypothetical protein QOF76_3695 [Solirubrobacteraceae bacterium]|nr:hypothetical protein [Solirubrobacteraceae bacterium]
MAPGQRFGRYTIEGIIGRGGMGIVYRALQDGLDRSVALKVITPHLAADPGFRSRFQREARLAASLEHPNVVPVYETGSEGDALFLAMRLIDADDLSTIIKRQGPFSVEETLPIVQGVADALDAAHNAGLVHRDVKPHNILRGADRVYLTDFGLTKSIGSGSELTATGTMLGTVDYSSPEQLLGDDLDRRSDVYALACTTYHLLTGSPPFPRNGDTARMLAHLNDPPPELPTGPEPLSATIRKGMAKNRDDRYATAGDFAAACKAQQAQEAHTAMRPRAATTVLRPEARRSRSRMGLAIGVPVLVVAGVLVALLAGGGGKDGGPKNAADTTASGTTTAGTTSTGTTATGGTRKPFLSKITDRRLAGANGVVGADGAVYAVNAKLGKLLRIDPDKGVVDDIDAGDHPSDVVFDTATRRLFVLSKDDHTLRRFAVDPKLRADGTTSVCDEPDGLALESKYVLYACPDPAATLVRVTVDGFKPAGSTPSDAGDPAAIFVGKRVWVTDKTNGTVQSFTKNTLHTFSDTTVQGSPDGGVEFLGYAWVALIGATRVVPFDTGTGQAGNRGVRVVPKPHHVAAAQGSIWVTSGAGHTVTEIDPQDFKAVQKVNIPDEGAQPLGITWDQDNGALWVTDNKLGNLYRIDPAK